MEKITFYSESDVISACLYKPEMDINNQKYPSVLLCHGFAGIKELLIDNFANTISAAGFVCMTFDYRGFGESSGQTVIDPLSQVQDIHNATEYLRSLPFVDEQRLALWGTSLGGANCILAAAMDSCYKAIAVQLTFGDGERVITAGQEKIKATTEGMMHKLWKREVVNNKRMMVPLTKMLNDEQSVLFMEENQEEYPQLMRTIPFSTLKNTYRIKPEKFVNVIEAPILIVGAEKDQVNPLEESLSLYEKANEPKELLVIEGASHYDAYQGSSFNRIVTTQIEFFKKYLH